MPRDMAASVRQRFVILLVLVMKTLIMYYVSMLYRVYYIV